MEGADMWVIQRGNGSGFTTKALFTAWIGCERLRENLDGDDPVETCIPPPVNLAHPTGANQAEDFVGAEPNAWGETHGGVTLARLYERTQAIPGTLQGLAKDPSP
jgi:hypothetical protein